VMKAKRVSIKVFFIIKYFKINIWGAHKSCGLICQPTLFIFSVKIGNFHLKRIKTYLG
jgi:hypothetical protein